MIGDAGRTKGKGKWGHSREHSTFTQEVECPLWQAASGARAESGREKALGPMRPWQVNAVALAAEEPVAAGRGERGQGPSSCSATRAEHQAARF